MAVRRESESKSRTALYTCSYAPIEIIMAAGLLPRRLIPEPQTSEADAYMHPNTCYYVKSLLASALAGNASQADAVVFADSCDGTRRLCDIWKEYVSGAPVFLIDIPKKSDADSIEFFASELGRFMRNLEEESVGGKVTDEGLEKAISICNNVRLLMEKVFRLQRDAGSDVSGISVFNLCMKAADTHPREFANELKRFVSDPGEETFSGAEQRIVLTGNVINRPDLIALIENSGGRVVALDSCLGLRQYDMPVRENTGDPVTALAERYLLRSSCARMEGIEERFQRLKKLVEDSCADGIVYSTVKFCDIYLYETPLMRASFDDVGIPFLALENDYAWTGIGQMKTRVEAFLAMTAERGSS